MERTLWTDERIDDAMERIDKRFDDVERGIAALRRDMHQVMLTMMTGFLMLAGIILAHG
jgi:hypothetical protein